MSAVEQRKAYRAVEGRMIAGVCRGLATHLGVSVAAVRAVLVAAAVFGSGAGLLAYLAFWALLPLDPDDDEAAPADPDRPQWIAGALLSAVVGFLALIALGFAAVTPYLLPAAIAVVGLALVWGSADDVQRASWRHDAAGMARGAVGQATVHGRWRAAIGALAVVMAIVGFSVSSVGLRTMVQGVATTVLLLVGLLLVAFPWLHERWAARVQQRIALVRADERAEMAARIHDSVMQTLTLVQKHADDPVRVQQLARAEEHALRDWLYGDNGDSASFSSAIQAVANEVETRHGISIEVVNVGDALVDSRLEALLSAAQEAMVNAAKHSGAGAVQVYSEVDDGLTTVFVRDRGRGFDLHEVAADRAGIRESIDGRMQRAGGSAVIRSALGEGTEVALRLPQVTP